MSGRRPLLNWLHRLDRVFSGHNEKVKKGKMKDGSTFITTYHWAKELFHRVGVYKYRNFSPLTRAFFPPVYRQLAIFVFQLLLLFLPFAFHNSHLFGAIPFPVLCVQLFFSQLWVSPQFGRSAPSKRQAPNKRRTGRAGKRIRKFDKRFNFLFFSLLIYLDDMSEEDPK